MLLPFLNFLSQILFRFQKHLEKVHDILQTALQRLPESEADLSLFNNSEIDEVDGSNADNNSNDPCDDLDRVMCLIIDNM